MISPAHSLMLKALGAATVVVACCLAVLILAPSAVYAQGESPSEVEEMAEDATTPEDSGGNEGEGSGEDSSGEATTADGQPVDDETQDAIDEASRGDAPAQGSVGEDRSGSEDGEESAGDGEGGFLNGIAVGMIKSIFNWIGDGIEDEAGKRAADLASQLTQGRYMIEPPNNELTELYDGVAAWAKFVAVPLLLLLGLSMCLNGANYDTSHAVQTGMPRIITMIAGMAFMPEIITVIADMTQSVSNAVIDVDAMQAGFESLGKGELAIKISPAAIVIVWIIKGLLSLLLLFAIAVQNLIFGVLFMVGPLALIFYAIPRFSDIAAAWFRGILACFAISVLWSLQFGFGYRLVGDPTLLYENTGWRLLPLLLSLGILWLAWKTPWWVYQWAFYSYSAGGGGSGTGTALRAVGLLKMFSSFSGKSK